MANLKYRPCVLIIMDGFGITRPSEYNAVSEANLEYFHFLINNYPTMLLDAAGQSVGLPFGESGNSEVGHFNIGSGRLIYQSLPRINNAINDGSFFKHPYLLQAAQRVKQTNSKLHIIGLIGIGGVHSHQRHLLALLEFCKSQKIDPNKVFLHLFLDGRDSAKDAGKQYLEQTIQAAKNIARVASVSGRFYAMDRNNKWDRTEKVYNAMVKGEAETLTKDPVQAVQDSYDKEIFDEEFVPIVVTDEQGQPVGKISDNDTLIFFNFRADRARQITRSIVEKDFKEFNRGEQLKNLAVITFTEYQKGLPVNVMYPPQIIDTPLAKVFSGYNLKQFHIAETEKYAHVTFFFNGLIEEPFQGEDRKIIQSPAVITYDEKPEMSAIEVMQNVLQAIQNDKYDFILVNFANPDMVGHTGKKQASIKAVETVDLCLSKIIPEVLKRNGICFVTADHGNVEELYNFQTYKIDKEHSVYPVPFITISNDRKGNKIQQPRNNDLSFYEPVGILADIAPTILTILGLPKESGMKGGLKV